MIDHDFELFGKNFVKAMFLLKKSYIIGVLTKYFFDESILISLISFLTSI